MLKLSVVLVRIRLPSPVARLHPLPFHGSTIDPKQRKWAEFIGACADGREAEIIPIRPPLSAAA